MTDQERLNLLSERAEKAASARAEAFSGKARELRERVEHLLEERHEIENQPGTIAEFVGQAKEELRAWRSDISIPALRKLFQEARPHRGKIFSESNLKLGLLDERNLYRLAGFLISEEMISEAAKGLPVINGISEKDRSAKLKELDSQIQKVEAEMEKLLAL